MKNDSQANMESGKERKALTSRQREVFEFIKERIQSTSRPPTLREIGVRFGISSTNGVRSILHALAKKQYIERAPKLSRGIDLPEVEKMAPDYREDVVEVPVLGRVAAGTPILAVENLEGTVVVDREFLMRQDGVFALKVTGDSMKDAGIMDGDMVFARQQRVADPGQIVIAGDVAAVDRACELATARGAKRALKLPVSVPARRKGTSCAGSSASPKSPSSSSSAGTRDGREGVGCGRGRLCEVVSRGRCAWARLSRPWRWL